MGVRAPSLLLCLFALLAGCYSPEPVWRKDRLTLAHVQSTVEPVRVYYRDLERGDAEQVLPEVAAVHSAVRSHLGFRPPATELVIYEPSGPIGAVGQQVHETRCELDKTPDGWVIGFVYPFNQDPRTLEHLVGTTAHEVAEATILLQVTVLDPYVRWMHDGIAELIEHEVLCRRNPSAARANLRRVTRFVAERRGEGVSWVNLARWRQLAPWVVRSHRFLGESEDNLSLEDIDQSINRVRRARRLEADPVFQGGLDELEVMLRRARRLGRLPWEGGEARTDDPNTRDFLFYNAAFAFWLGVERARPGTVRRYVTALARKRSGDDHVITSEEVLEMLREAAEGAVLPPLERFTLEEADRVLRAEQLRLG